MKTAILSLFLLTVSVQAQERYFPCTFSWVDTRDGGYERHWIGVQLIGDTLFVVGDMTKEETKWMLLGYEMAGGGDRFIEPIGATPLSLSALTPKAYRLLRGWAGL